MGQSRRPCHETDRDEAKALSHGGNFISMTRPEVARGCSNTSGPLLAAQVDNKLREQRSNKWERQGGMPLGCKTSYMSW